MRPDGGVDCRGIGHRLQEPCQGVNRYSLPVSWAWPDGRGQESGRSSRSPVSGLGLATPAHVSYALCVLLFPVGNVRWKRPKLRFLVIGFGGPNAEKCGLYAREPLPPREGRIALSIRHRKISPWLLSKTIGGVSLMALALTPTGTEKIRVSK